MYAPAYRVREYAGANCKSEREHRLRPCSRAPVSHRSALADCGPGKRRAYDSRSAALPVYGPRFQQFARSVFCGPGPSKAPLLERPRFRPRGMENQPSALSQQQSDRFIVDLDDVAARDRGMLFGFHPLPRSLYSARTSKRCTRA